MAEPRRRKRNVLAEHVGPPIVYLGDDGMVESRPDHNHSHPSRSELGEHRVDRYRPKSLRRISRALSRTRSPSRAGRTRWSSQARPSSVVRDATMDAPAQRASASHGGASSSTATRETLAAQRRVEPWPAQESPVVHPQPQPQSVQAQTAAATQQPAEDG